MSRYVLDLSEVASEEYEELARLTGLSVEFLMAAVLAEDAERVGREVRAFVYAQVDPSSMGEDDIHG